eukprot:4220913-Alexandrium_andersonii.AAC.1
MADLLRRLQSCEALGSDGCSQPSHIPLPPLLDPDEPATKRMRQCQSRLAGEVVVDAEAALPSMDGIAETL